MMDWSKDLSLAQAGFRRAAQAASAFVDGNWLEQARNLEGAGQPRPESGSVPAVSTVGVTEVADFGTNPGRLRMLTYEPLVLRRHSPMVVVLHGCGQEAAAFAEDSGWIALAERLRIPLILPEQVRDNNRGGCFNWFNPAQTRRDQGEALSIRQMVATGLRRTGGNPEQVFVVGLSAGGAMAAAILASYPDVFAAGAVVAGLPAGCATAAPQALARMSQPGPSISAEDWGALVRASSPAAYRGPWPRLSIWHGGVDRVVDPGNADLLVTQWRDVHGIGAAPGRETRDGGATHVAWGAPGKPAVELWNLPDLGHGYPIAAAQGGEGRASRWVIDSGVDATLAIADFWNLA